MPPVCRTIKRLLPLACCFILLNLLLQDDKQREANPEDNREKEATSDDKRDWEAILGHKREGEAKLGSNRLREAMLEDEKDERLRVGERQREVGMKSASPLFPLDWFEKPDTKASMVQSPWSGPQHSDASPLQGDKTEITASLNHPWNVLEVLPLWMRISDDLYAYSAFWDARQGLPTGPAVRVLGILKYHKELIQESPGYQWSGVVREDALKYSCFLWYTGQDAEEGQLSAFIYEEGLKTFVGTYFLCSPKNVTSDSSTTRHDKGQVPYAVSLVPHGANNTSQRLIYLTQGSRTEQGHGGHHGAVCVRPLFGPYADLAAIALFISYYNTVLNVSHFYFYDFAIERNVREFFMHLMPDGDVGIHLLPWNIPTSEWEELWDLGSLTSINDCVYRASEEHDHVAIVDLDEFIVPRTPVNTLGQLYNTVIKHKRGSEGDSVLILNAFFCSEFQNKSDSNKDFIIFQATLREPRLWPPKSRSKMVVVPKAVVAVGHHMVHHFLQPASKNQASPKLVSVLHHYRNCAGLRTGIHATGSEVVQQKPMRDKAILKYKSAVLASRIMRQYLHFTHDT